MKTRGQFEVEVLGGKTIQEYCAIYSYDHFKAEVEERMLQEQIKVMTEIAVETHKNGLKIGEALQRVAKVLSQ